MTSEFGNRHNMHLADAPPLPRKSRQLTRPTERRIELKSPIENSLQAARLLDHGDGMRSTVAPPGEGKRTR